MPKRIPITAAKRVAQDHGLKQCLLIGWDGAHTHVVTYGATKADCAQAATAQDFWTGKIREFSFRGSDNDRLAAALRELIGYCEIAAVAPAAIGKTLVMALDGPELTAARAALQPIT